MKIKRFFAPDMRQAIHQVRTEQGPDAVILSTRSTAGGVEIVAAIDYDAELVSGMFGAPSASSNSSHSSSSLSSAASPDTGRDEPVTAAPATREFELELEPDLPTPDTLADELSFTSPVPERRVEWPRPATPEPRIEWAQDPALQAMQAELGALRSILQDQVSRLATAEQDRRDPLRAEVVRRLVTLGIDESLAREIAADSSATTDPARAWREAMFRLAARIPVVGQDPLENQGVIALVGATGVGKTTTAAKLAARACLRYGSQSVALVSTDDFRVGAQRQLSAFALLLGVPVRQAESAAELQARVEEFSGRRLVIVDTAGMGQRDFRLLDESRKLDGIRGLQSYLVLPANVQREVMDEVIEAFGPGRLAGCMLTKIDEARRIGPALSALAQHGLPAAYASQGQRVPEDLALARTQDLVARAMSARPAGAALRRAKAPPRPPTGLPATPVTRKETRHACA